MRVHLRAEPGPPREWFVEANFSGDKKATSRSFQRVRGKRVIAEVRIPKGLVEETLHTSPEQMSRYFQFSTLGSVLSGALGTRATTPTAWRHSTSPVSGRQPAWPSRRRG